MKSLYKKALAFDKWLDSHLPLLLILALLLILRIPNFFEPYWYGDEGIYLAIGNALRQGKILYLQIVDHKTPIIYYLAMFSGSQLHFRVLLLSWMTVSTLAFFHLCKELLQKTWTIFLSLILFVVLTSLPWFEGNIANGELFVIGFVLVGAYFLSGTKLFNDMFSAENSWLKNIGIGNKEESLSAILPGIFSRDLLLYFISGIFFSLAVLSKVPAIFDFFAFASIFYFAIFNKVKFKKFSLKTFLKLIFKRIPAAVLITLGFLTPIALSVLYYASRMALGEYLNYGLLYNFRYAGSWGLPFDNPLLKIFFTLPGKFLISLVVILFLTIFKKKVKPAFQFVATWFVLALFASLLSNRPYPHYFLQVIPPLALLIGMIFDNFLSFKCKKMMIKTVFEKDKINVFELGSSLFLVLLFLLSLLLLKVGLYPTASYYDNFYKYVSGRRDLQTYQQNFNHLMRDNYEAAELIHESGEREIFVWGTNPMLYAMTDTSPVGPFTVSFHMREFDAYQLVLDELKLKRPFFIVQMQDERDEYQGFYEFLQDSYLPNGSFKYFTLWKLK